MRREYRRLKNQKIEEIMAGQDSKTYESAGNKVAWECAAISKKDDKGNNRMETKGKTKVEMRGPDSGR